MFKPVSKAYLALKPDPGFDPALNKSTNLGPGVLTSPGTDFPQNS